LDGFRGIVLNRKVFIRLIVIATGAGIILLSLFAFQIGLDNDPGWGPRRFQILGVGIAIILFGALYWITPLFSRWFVTSAKPIVESSFSQRELSKPIVDSKLRQSAWFNWLIRNQTNIWLVLLACSVIWAYIWIITIGRMEKWPDGRNYYWLLTQAFQKGQTYLLVDPPSELLALKNPYDLQQRKGLDYLWDTTLYNGKYYLYWGPVPAALGVIINFITSRPVTDTGLVFSFVLGTALFSILLLKQICQDYQFPGWVFWGGALASAINIPLIWLLTHPTYYEVSISGGQFFMMAGFFLLYLALRSSSLPRGFLIFSAFAFGLAGGTRVNLLPSVIFLAFMILCWIYFFHQRKFSAATPVFLAVITPLAIIAFSLASYNYIRFGSIFEFGHRYQLSGVSLTADDRDQVSVNYILPSLYTYVLRSPALSGKFPFITVPWIRESMWPFFIHLPENYYYPEPTAGILFVIPLVGLTAIVVVRFLWLLANGDASLRGNKAFPASSPFFWFGLCMLGYILIQAFLLFAFVSSSMRYLVDLSPALIVLSAMFFGYHVQSFEKKPYMVKMLASLWLLAAVLTVAFGFLIGLTGSQNNFLNENPQLYNQLLEWFGR